MSLTKEFIIEIKNKIIENYSDCKIIETEDYPYFYIKANTLADILNISNIRHSIINYDKNKKISIKEKTTNGIKPTNYLSIDGILKLLSKSRKVETINFCEKININTNLYLYGCTEADAFKCILESFEGENMIMQYGVDNYRIDLYFVDKKLAIECDEQHRNIEVDNIREEYIKNKLGCTFIRFKPYEKDFSVYKVINQIYKILIIKTI